MMRLLFAVFFSLFAVSAYAETLQQAMVRAYQTNPVLQKAQAKLRTVDEGVPLAKSGARPSADFDASVSQSMTNRAGAQTDYNPRGFGVSVTQPLYKGGRIDAGIDSAEKAVLAERANLHDAEQSLFLSVANSYFDVWRDQAVLKLNRKNEDVLRQELQAASDRFKVGEATRTDVSQADSRLSGATAERIESEGKLSNSKATYEKIIGIAPVELKEQKVDFALPQNLDEAIKLAQEQNPKVISSKYSAESAIHDVDVAQGALLPEISLQAGANQNWDVSGKTGIIDSAQITAQLTMPLYRSGADYARTRAAKETASQRRIEIHSALDTAKETAVSAWDSLKTAQAAIRARQKQVESAELAFQGVKEESKVGTRTILDRLNAEAEALQAKVNLVQAQRDQAVAMFNVKAAVGDLTAEKLALPLTAYNAQDHYEAVKDSWIGLGESLELPASDSSEATPNTETEALPPIQPKKEMPEP